MTGPLSGLAVLVAEDEFFIAAMLADTLEDAGARIVGPASSLADGLSLAGQGGIDLAVLDWNLAGEESTAIAGMLHAAGVPFVIASGYGAAPEGFPGVEVLVKPFDPQRLVEELARLAAASGLGSAA